jgi:hypothetical protein
LFAVGFFAIEPTISMAATRTVGSSEELRDALVSANRGDVVELKNGVYSGNFKVSSDGITIRAQNRHAAILRGNGARKEANFGLSMNASQVTIEDLRFEKHYGAVWGNSDSAHEVTVRNNLIVNFYYDGVRMRGDNWQVYNNVIGLSQQSEGGGRGISIRSGNHNKVYDNILYAISGDNIQAEGPETGGCITTRPPATNNLFQGNMCIVSGDKSNVAIWTSTADTDTNTHNVFRDNIFAWGDAGGFSPRDRRSNDNSFINNLCYEVENCAGGKGNTPGRNKVIHNTVIVTEFSGPVAMQVGRDEGSTEQNRIFKSNLMYSKVKHSGKHYNFLHAAFDAGTSYKSENHSHNLYWAPWDEENWGWSREGNFVYTATDIHSSTKRPIFVDEAHGDYTLAPHSPGAGAGHDGANIGIEWNDHLKLAKFQHLLALPTQEKPTNGGTSINFSGLPPGHEYLVEVYVPASNFFTGTEEYRVEGNKVSRDLNELFNQSMWFTGRSYSGANRYVSLGNHPVSDDGVLDVKWSHGNAAQRIFIRELPTPEQAYRWITDSQPPQQGPIAAFTRIEAEWFGQASGPRRVNAGTADDGIGHIDAAGWALYPNVDFEGGAASVQVQAASKNSGVIQLRLDSIDGPLLGSCPINNTGGWQSWQWFSADVKGAQGVHDLYLVFEGQDGLLENLMNVNAFVFTQAASTDRPYPPVGLRIDPPKNGAN